MYFVVISDNHGNEEILSKLRNRHPDACAYIHCGDSELPVEAMDGWVSVRGNTDYYPGYEDKKIVKINDRLNVLVIHSHRQSINRLKTLAALAKENNCQMVCYGHTHVFAYDEVDGIKLLNPGSLFYNRDRSPISYALVYLSDFSDSVTVKRMEVKK